MFEIVKLEKLKDGTTDEYELVDLKNNQIKEIVEARKRKRNKI